MKLNHIDLQVPNVPETAAFFERHFAFTWHGNRQSPAIAILTGEDGFTLVLQRRAPGEAYPENFHVGFLVADEAVVHDKRAEIAATGLRCGDVTKNGRGVMFYFEAPGGILVEIGKRR